MYCVHVMYMYLHQCMSGTSGGQKRALDFLELKLQVAVSH